MFVGTKGCAILYVSFVVYMLKEDVHKYLDNDRTEGSASVFFIRVCAYYLKESKY